MSRPGNGKGTVEPVVIEGHRIDARWRRQSAIGTSVAMIWLLSVMVFVTGACLTHRGPFGWFASGELALLGSENSILLAVPLYILLLVLPYGIVSRLPRRLDRPLLCGMQEAIDPRRVPIVPPAPGAVLRRMIRLRRGGFVVGMLLLLAGLGNFCLTAWSGAPAGRPLMAMTVEAVTRPGAALPPVARIVAAEDHVSLAWIRNHSIRQTRYRDYYFPLTEVGWRPGDPVRLVELDALLPDEPPTASNVFDPPGPREGALSRDAPKAWVVGEMRRHGLHVVDHPFLLERQSLGGVTPGPDMITAWLLLAIAVGLALFAWLFAWGANRQVRMLRD